MSLTTFLLELGLVAAGFYGLRQWKHWLFWFAIAAGLIGSLASVVTYAATGRFWLFAPWDLVLTPAAVTVAVLALGPQFRSGSRWAEARFDRDLYAGFHAYQHTGQLFMHLLIDSVRHACFRAIGDSLI